MTVALPGGGSLVIRPLDVSRLAGRNDFVGVLNGGPGNDILSGSPVRDRLDGASGNDTLYGFAGDDRLFGGSDGSANDHDVVFAGQGNDDLVGGSGTNELYAWTRDPKTGAQFGLFVNENGELVTDNGDLDGDDLLDSDGVSKPYQPENTGLNRMLGSQYEDDMYGGTGLDFIYGNGGNDRTFRSDGTEFNSSDQDLGGESWIAYARSNSGVWYIGGTDRADEIRLNYVTEDGILSGRHVVTRSTSIIDLNGVPRNTFSVEANLDFNGKDADGNLIWNPSGLVYNPATNSFFDDTNTIAGLLPPEQPVQAVIIDARGGDDTVIVGETVQATVWVSAGAGNDYVHIRSGNALLPDASEVDRRNDSIANAFELQQPQLPAVLLGNVDAPANGVLDAASSFTLKIDDNAPVAVAIPLAAIQGEDGSFANENIDDLIYDLNGALKVAGLGTQVTATRQGNRIMLVSTNRGDAATLRIRASASDPIIRQLGFVNDFEAQGTSATSRFAYEDLTIDSNSDQDFYRLSLGQTTGSNATVTLISSAATDGLIMSLYAEGEGSSVSLIGTNPDTWDVGSESNNTRATAKVLTGIDQLVGITGLSLYNSADQDFFKFTTTRTGIRTDSISIRQTDGDQPLNLILTNAAGVSIPGTIRANSDGKIHQFSLDTLPAGDYWLQVTSEGAARYELVPNIGNVGSTLINLNQHVTTTISIGDQPEGTYFLKVASPNQLPTVYNLAFDLNLPDGILVPAQDLANSSFKVVRRDVITGDAGNDVLIGGLGEDWIFGGDGNDLISGGLDQQASDLLFGGAGSDTMQLFPDQLPTLEGTNTTFVPTYSDRFDGGTGEDRILYLGGDYTTDPATGAIESIPDYVSVRYNTQLHRYEFTALRYDVANNHFEVAPNGTQYAQYYQFFQAQNVEELVIDVQAGDDVVRADAEYKFPGTDSEWGIKRGNAQQGGNLALTIEGGDGNDILYGGDQSDIIDGGDGADIIVGGNGDDLLFGGGGNDKIAGYHDGSRTPADTFDDISVPQLALPGNLAANRSPAVYRTLPIGTTALLQDRAPRVTVQSGDSIGDATTLHTSTTGELLIGVTAVGDLNADGFADFVVTSSLTHYVFFGPVDLSALDLVAGMTSVDAYDLAGRADVLISASVGKLVGGPVNVNGDDVRGDRVAVTGAAAVNDLLFVGQNGTTATISVLFGGAAIRDGQADTFWPRQIRSLQDLDSFNWRTVFVTLPVSTPVTTSLFDEDGDGATDLLLSSDYKVGLKSAITISGRSIVGPDTTGTVTGQTLTPTTTYWLPVSTVGGTTPAAKIYAVGDLNGDGLDDVVGVVAADPTHSQPGRVYIHYLRPETPTNIDLTQSYDRLISDDYLSSQLTAAGDLNKDGFDDILLQRSVFTPSSSGGSSAAGSNGVTTTTGTPSVPDLNGSVHLRTAESPWLNPEKQLSVQLWVRVDRLNVEWQPIFIKSDESIPSRTVTLWVNSRGYFHFTSAAAGHDQDYMNVYPENGRSLVTGRWYHVTGVVDRVTGKMTVFINGVQVQQQDVRTGNIVHSSHGLMVGNTSHSDGNFRVLDGSVADVRYFGRALSSSEISSGWNSTNIANRDDLLAWYRFSETSGNAALDSSGFAHHATYFNGGVPAGGRPIEPARGSNASLNSCLNVQPVTLGPSPLDASNLYTDGVAPGAAAQMRRPTWWSFMVKPTTRSTSTGSR
ncbi:MAG: LamG-like jellyroll fold domain-containing protein, partial [Planctomycetaceae bacterium]